MARVGLPRNLTPSHIARVAPKRPPRDHRFNRASPTIVLAIEASSARCEAAQILESFYFPLGNTTAPGGTNVIMSFVPRCFPNLHAALNAADDSFTSTAAFAVTPAFFKIPETVEALLATSCDSA